jgi:hypothetical protein
LGGLARGPIIISGFFQDSRRRRIRRRGADGLSEKARVKGASQGGTICDHLYHKDEPAHRRFRIKYEISIS